MPQLFVDPEQEVEIKIYAASLKNGKVVADMDKDELQKMYEEELDSNSVEEHVAVFRVPSYLDNTAINGAAMSFDGNGLQVNPSILRLKRMSTLIKSWDFLDKNKHEVAPNEKNISALHPAIATILGLTLESKLDSLGY